MKRGFTLIELLAVMVVLAVLALITVPIVFNIIEDNKANAKSMSSELYLKAIDYAISQATLDNNKVKNGVYDIMYNGNICLENYNSSQRVCNDTDGNDNNNELVIDVSGETPVSGIIEVNGRKVESSRFIYKSGVTTVTNSEICKLIEGVENQIGSKYECEVKKGTKYNFFVLSHNSDETTNLIMEKNIHYDSTNGVGIIADNTTNKGAVKWYESAADNSYGPITAMSYLHSATKDWDNIPNIIMNYTDEARRYGTIKTTGTITTTTKITKREGVVTLTLENLKARLPMRKEVDDTGCDGTGKPVCAIWVSNNLANPGVLGYWTLSSVNNDADAYRVRFDNASGQTAVNTNWGVRPVITVKL